MIKLIHPHKIKEMETEETPELVNLQPHQSHRNLKLSLQNKFIATDKQRLQPLEEAPLSKAMLEIQKVKQLCKPQPQAGKL